ncbi:MAG: histidine kinase [Bacteroidetes bacterium]|nr:histidine kinase [Bacteroidota bacterium]
MKNRQVIFHLSFWIAIYVLWVFIFRSYSIRLTKTMTVEFCYLIFITADFYVINHLLVPRFLLKKRYLAFATSTILCISVSALLRSLLAIQMNLHYFHDAPIDNFGLLYFNSLVNIGLWVFLTTVVKLFIDRMQTQKEMELMEKERIKSELDYLKAQINPHSLFNSLNTVYGNIDKNNQTARNILLQFSELLRYQLYECGAEKVNLSKEIIYIKNYIAFQRLRKDENLVVHSDIETAESRLEIAPLLLVVLIENAFKFVSNFPNRENKICIKIGFKGNELYSSFINTKEVQKNGINGNSNGIGIANLKRRLELLYAGKYELTTKEDEERYETKLKIDLV